MRRLLNRRKPERAVASRPAPLQRQRALATGLLAAAKRGQEHVLTLEDHEFIAVEALIETTGPSTEPYWLSRGDFVTRFIHVWDEVDAATKVRLARVAWRDAIEALDAGELSGPAWAERALRLAASMAAGVPVSLKDCAACGRITGLDLAEAATYAASEDQS